MTEYRWLTNSEIEVLVNPDIQKQGWAALNLNESQPTCRVLGAFVDDQLVESFTIQMYPFLGPMIRHMPELRDSGEISRALAAAMGDFVEKSGARDVIAVADSPVTERLCQRFGMHKLEVPVYTYKTTPQS